jgi:hypothetical protein
MSRAGILLRQARRAAVVGVVLALLPWWLFTHAAIDAGNWQWRPWFDLPALLLLALLAAVAVRGRSRRWLSLRLDRRREFEDSSALLWQHTEPGSLPDLQRARLQSRVAAVDAATLGFGPPWRLLFANALAAGGFALVLLLWLQPRADPVPSATAPVASTDPGLPQLMGQRLTIQPPAYTGLPPQTVDTLDAALPEGALLRWRLQFAPPPASAALRFLDGEELPLAPVDGSWQAERRIERATRYRLLVDGELLEPQAPAARLDVTADQPPTIVVSAPAQTLTLLEAATPVELLFEAGDDYGLGAAELRLTLAQGDGENVQVSERRLALRGEGSNTLQRFRQRIDLAALGFARGDDLILRIVVADNRALAPQATQSPAYILRWPSPPTAEVEGFDGLVQRTLPAYFRSQRQIIIDSEALLERRPELAADDFVQRSDAIGVDQRLLRLRYGQFLGEEAEGGAVAALPEGHSHDDGHDHGEHEAAAGADEAQALMAQFGHLHDQAEAATLFDPATRELLRAALREMWQSELHLRQGAPQLALPYQYRALDFIKQVQQANRVYLARVGLELPPIDFGRRLGGDRSALRPRADPLPDPAREPDPAEALWRALAPDAGREPRIAALAAFAAHLRQRHGEARDALALQEALEAMQRDPDCAACREALRRELWPLLPPATAGVVLRPPPNEAGRRYLEALEEPAR